MKKRVGFGALTVVFLAVCAAVQPSSPSAIQAPRQPYVGPIRWDHPVVVRRGRAVRLRYQRWVVPERAVVATSRRSVRITLYGREPVHSGPGVSPAAVFFGCVEVQLRGRIGRRKLIDGRSGRVFRPDRRRTEADRYRERSLRRQRGCQKTAVAYKPRRAAKRSSVPKVTGRTVCKAERGLAAAGLHWRYGGSSVIYSRPQPPPPPGTLVSFSCDDDQVVRQRPRAGRRLRPGSVVFLETVCTLGRKRGYACL